MSQQSLINPTCPECGGKDIIRDREVGEAVCRCCGLVIQENTFDLGPEWRAFNPVERNSRTRVGAPTKYCHYDKGLSTIIPVDRDSFGRSLSPNVKRKMRRLRRWQIRSNLHASHDRNLIIAMNELQRLSEKLQIPSSIHEMAAVIYRKALNTGLVRGRVIASIVAGSLYAACRFTKTPRTLREIADASLRDLKEISRAYRLVIQNLKMEMPIDSPIDYVAKIAEKAGVTSNVEGVAVKIIRDAQNRRVVMGKDPSGLAAAAIYMASRRMRARTRKKKKITQGLLAKAAGVSEVTIRNRKNELVKSLA